MLSRHDCIERARASVCLCDHEECECTDTRNFEEETRVRASVCNVSTYINIYESALGCTLYCMLTTANDSKGSVGRD